MSTPPIDLAKAEQIIAYAAKHYLNEPTMAATLESVTFQAWDYAGPDEPTHWRLAAAATILADRASAYRSTLPLMAASLSRLSELYANAFRIEVTVGATVVPDTAPEQL